MMHCVQLKNCHPGRGTSSCASTARTTKHIAPPRISKKRPGTQVTTCSKGSLGFSPLQTRHQTGPRDAVSPVAAGRWEWQTAEIQFGGQSTFSCPRAPFSRSPGAFPSYPLYTYYIRDDESPSEAARRGISKFRWKSASLGSPALMNRAIMRFIWGARGARTNKI